LETLEEPAEMVACVEVLKKTKDCLVHVYAVAEQMKTHVGSQRRLNVLCIGQYSLHILLSG